MEGVVVGAGNEAAVTFVNMAAVSCACLSVCAQVRLGANKQASKLTRVPFFRPLIN